MKSPTKKCKSLAKQMQVIDQKMAVTDQKMQVINETNASYQPKKKKNGSQLPKKSNLRKIHYVVFIYICMYI